MSLSIVPVIFLTLMVVLANIDNGTESKSYQKKESVNHSINKDLSKTVFKENKNDLDTIYQFIRTKFKKVSEEDAKKIAQNLVSYGKQFQVDPKFAAAVIARESGFKKDAVSVTGAKGLGQIKDFNFKDLNIHDPFNINQNVSGTVQYLKKMIQKWNDEPRQTYKEKQKEPLNKHGKIKLALASYYKGFTAVTKQGIDNKTNKYVDDIMDYYREILNYEK